MKAQPLISTNYRYSALPKSGDVVCIFDAYDKEKLNGRTGVIIPMTKSKTVKLINVYGIGIIRLHFKSFYKISL